MFCIIRVGLDLCLMGDCMGFFSGFSYLCPIGHASSAVLMSFKWELATSSAWRCQCQPGGVVGLLPSWAQCQAGCWWAWLRGAYAASASSPLLEGQVKGKKKRGVGSKRNWIFCVPCRWMFPDDSSFLWNSSLTNLAVACICTTCPGEGLGSHKRKLFHCSALMVQKIASWGSEQLLTLLEVMS